jgi:hypothetical protein
MMERLPLWMASEVQLKVRLSQPPDETMARKSALQ